MTDNRRYIYPCKIYFVPSDNAEKKIKSVTHRNQTKFLSRDEGEYRQSTKLKIMVRLGLNMEIDRE